MGFAPTLFRQMFFIKRNLIGSTKQDGLVVHLMVLRPGASHQPPALLPAPVSGEVSAEVSKRRSCCYLRKILYHLARSPKQPRLEKRARESLLGRSKTEAGQACCSRGRCSLNGAEGAPWSGAEVLPGGWGGWGGCSLWGCDHLLRHG